MGLPNGYQTHAWAMMNGRHSEFSEALQEFWRVDRFWDFEPGGSSGLFGVQVALGLGYERIFLAGMGLVRENGEPYLGAEVYDIWRKEYPLMKDRVRSFSGWTRNLLGESYA